MTASGPINDTESTGRQRVALCLYGITRSLRYTAPSLLRNVIEPASSCGDLKVYGHFFRQAEIANPRSGEFGRLDPDEYRLLPLDEVQLDAPKNAEVQALYDAVQVFGAGWKGDFASLMNLCHQLISLKKVTEAALSGTPDGVIFARPDLLYHDSLGPVIKAATEAGPPMVFSPYWQKNSGMNDRFCVIRGVEPARAFGMRADIALAYCSEKQRYLPAEAFAQHAMAGFPLQPIPQRASRIRFDGSRRKESFDTPQTAYLIKRAHEKLRHGGLRSVTRHILRGAQALRHGRRYSGLGFDQVAEVKASSVPAAGKLTT